MADEWPVLDYVTPGIARPGRPPFWRRALGFAIDAAITLAVALSVFAAGIAAYALFGSKSG